MVDEKFIAEMKEILVAQRNDILNSISEKSDDLKKLISTVDSGDVVDIASDAVDRTLLDSLNAQDSERLQKINNALNRMQRGLYGQCMLCHKDIPQARLRALPSAFMCIDCQNKEELRNR